MLFHFTEVILIEARALQISAQHRDLHLTPCFFLFLSRKHFKIQYQYEFDDIIQIYNI